MLVQATSPFTQKEHFNEGLDLFDKHDSVLSCCESKRFSWRNGKALNYDIYNRPRRQDFQGTLIENGAFYITSREMLIKNKLRYSGKIGIVEMSEMDSKQIDTYEDFEYVAGLQGGPGMVLARTNLPSGKVKTVNDLLKVKGLKYAGRVPIHGSDVSHPIWYNTKNCTG